MSNLLYSEVCTVRQDSETHLYGMNSFGLSHQCIRPQAISLPYKPTLRTRIRNFFDRCFTRWLRG